MMTPATRSRKLVESIHKCNLCLLIACRIAMTLLKSHYSNKSDKKIFHDEAKHDPYTSRQGTKGRWWENRVKNMWWDHCKLLWWIGSNKQVSALDHAAKFCAAFATREAAVCIKTAGAQSLQPGQLTKRSQGGRGEARARCVGVQCHRDCACWWDHRRASGVRQILGLWLG